MAGAVSAGAYTAGVLDFLVQALDEWQQAKDDGRDCPQHDVRIKVMAGASAGGMNTAILSTLFSEPFEPITSLPGRLPNAETARKNKLYASWVDQIDIDKLLRTDDLKEKNVPVRSLLDSTVLDEIADNALRFSPHGNRRKYLADELHLFFTLTNLRGVPYAISFRGTAQQGHALSQHADHMHFVLSDRQPAAGDALWLDPNDPDRASWQTLKKAALATGAFPGGLAPRLLSRSSSTYQERTWPIPQPEHASGSPCVQMKQIPPSWPGSSGDEPFEYEYLCVDGGVMNNEPFELARRHLAGGSAANPRAAKHVARTVLMIDPFPAANPMLPEDVSTLKDYDIVDTLLRMVTSLKHQARFKMDELALAQAQDVYSRFLITPTRYGADGSLQKHPLASGVMGAFGGFLSRQFRQHDFQLGRRNCQQFLRRHFTLPLDQARKNPIFAGDDPGLLDQCAVSIENQEGVREERIPIIPLLGSAREEAFPLQWKTLRVDENELGRLRKKVNRRTQAVTERLLETHLDGLLARTAAKLFLRYKRSDIVKGVMTKIEKDLTRYDLLSGSPPPA